MAKERIRATRPGGIRMAQDNAQPEGDGSRPYLFVGLAIIGVGLVVLLQDGPLREDCRHVLLDPEFRGACREVVATAVAKLHSGVGNGDSAALSSSAY